MSQDRLTYLVTGASKRIGRSISLRAAREGANVVVHYNKSKSHAEELAAEVEKLGVNAYLISSDLEDAQAAQETMQKAWDIAGSIDVLINNASIFDLNRLTDFTADDLTKNVLIHAYAPLALTRKFAELNKSRELKDRPTVINLLDTRITDYDREHSAYHLSKRMLFSITKLSAIEFAPAIRVNAVAPGLILPPEGYTVEYLNKLRDKNPLHDIGDPEYIADAVSYLAGARFVTGQVIYVDGGRHLNGNVFGL